MSNQSNSTTTLPPNFQNKPSSLPCPNSSASFWHSEPNPFLYNYRSSTTLPSSADIIIIGSGITGASIARYLTSDPRITSASSNNNQKQRILLLEARQICWGATGRNGGHCQPLLFDRSPSVARFEVKNVDAVRSYIEEHNVPCEWRDVTGCRSFWTDELFERAKNEIEKLKREDAELGGKVKVIEKGDVQGLKEHRVDGKARGVTLTEGAGQLWPYKYVSFIVEKLVREGKVEVFTNCPVVNIESIAHQDGGGTTTTDANGDDSNNKSGPGLYTLTTPLGSISSRHVILATNGYTSHLLPSFTNLIVPVRCEMSALHPPPNSTRLPNSYGMVGFEGGNPDFDDYLIQRPFYPSSNTNDDNGTPKKMAGGHLMFGGGRSFATYNCLGESDDDIVDPGEAKYLRGALLKVLDLGGDADVEGSEVNKVGELRASHQWTGIKGYSRDNMPWVGKVPVVIKSQDDEEGGEVEVKFQDGLWLCGGYTGHGMPNATLCGKAVVEMVLAEEEERGGKKTNGDGTLYSSVCEELVKNGELPRSYLITKERLDAANQLPSVAEQEAIAGGHTLGNVATTGMNVRQSTDTDIDAEGKNSRCTAM